MIAIREAIRSPLSYTIGKTSGLKGEPLKADQIENLTQIFPKLFIIFFLSIFWYPGYMIYIFPL